MFSNSVFSNFLYEIKYHVSYNKQNFRALATTCKRSHVDKLNDVTVGPFRVRIEKKPKNQKSLFTFLVVTPMPMSLSGVLLVVCHFTKCVSNP